LHWCKTLTEGELGKRLESYERAVNIRDNLDTALGHLGVAITHVEKAVDDAGRDHEYSYTDLVDLLGALRLARPQLVMEQDEWSGSAMRRKDML
jgi:hypothetical protein